MGISIGLDGAALHAEAALGIRTLRKPTRVGQPITGLMCAGARDRPPATGNVRRGVIPLVRLAAGEREGALQVHLSRLSAAPSLRELVAARSRLIRGEVLNRQ